MNARNNLLFIAAIFLLSGCGTAARLKKADKRYDNGEYYAAADIYKNTQSKISSQKQRVLKSQVNFKLGECYSYISEHNKAIRAYSSAIKYKYNDSIVYLHIAKSQLYMGRYSEAKKNFEIYLKSHPDSYEARAGLESATTAKDMAKEFSRYKVTAAKEFNFRRSSDFCPMFMSDEGDAIAITTNRDNSTSRKNSSITGMPNNDIFIGRKNNSGKWETLTPIEGAINSDEDEGAVTFSKDKKTIYFTRGEAKKEASMIYQSNRSGGEWTEPTPVILFSDSTISVGHPALSPDGERLYFTSDAPGGYGNKDIWVATNNNGKWEGATNLGRQINTSGNEMFPYVDSNGTLYFSSDGHPGFGGLDIYSARQDSTGNWHIHNMLSPINSSKDDFGITFSADGYTGYFSSNRNQSRPTDKIYRIDLPPLIYAIEGKVTDENGNTPGEATIRLVGDNGDNVKIRTKKDGSYRIQLALDTRYIMMASLRGYLNSSHEFNTHNLKDSKTFNNTFILTSVSKPVKLDNIFYEFGKWTLTPESESGLNALIKILTDNPNIAMEIAAHTDMIGNDENNMELSLKRAQSVVNYLINAGIDPNRLTPKGYGESQPVTVDSPMAKQYSFLKEGDILTPEFIEKLTEDQQGICNQINRRTEFKVTKTTYNLY